MDNINQIWANYNGSMYGASIRYPIHAYRSPFQKSKEDYFLDVPYGYGYPPYVNPNQLFAADGTPSPESKKDEVALPMPPSRGMFDDNVPIVIAGAVGAVAGYFVAKGEGKNVWLGALIGGGVTAGVISILKK